MNGTKTNTGDGHEMAKAIGAMEDEYPHPLMLDPEQLMPYLRVNKRGVRFTAEYEAYTIWQTPFRHSRAHTITTL